MVNILINGVLTPEPAHLTAQRLADQATANAPPTAVLLMHAGVIQKKLANGGLTILLPNSVTVLASTDAGGRVDISGLYTMATANSAFTTIWVQSTGPITLNAAQIIQVADAVLAFYQATFQALADVTADVNASKITTLAGVKAASYWPSATTDLTKS